MGTELIKTEIQEKDLQLVVSKKMLGSLTTNAKQIKSLVENALPNYSIANYNEDNIDLAKKDKAMLNNAAKILTTKRIEIEKEFAKPFLEFKGIVNDTVKLISECSGKIDSVVKQSDQKAKDSKRALIQKYWDSKSFALVTFAKIFDDKWLNKTTTEKAIQTEIDAKIVKINNDIATLEAIGEDSELLKSLYLDTLDLNGTIQYANTLKKNREKLKTNPVSIPTPQPSITFLKPQPTTHYQPIADNELMTRVFKVITTRDNIIALGDFMNAKGIDFEKISYEA